MPEGVLPFVIEHPGPDLQQRVRPAQAPAHLLLFTIRKQLWQCRSLGCEGVEIDPGRGSAMFPSDSHL